MAKFEKVIPNFQNGIVKVKKRFTRIAAEKAVNFFKKSFRDQGFTNKKLKKWDDRKKSKNKKTRAKNKGRAILVKRGTLRRSIEPKHTDNTFGALSDLVYAAVHNEGGKAGKNLSANIPKRQFIGESKKLLDQAEKDYLDMLEKEFLKS